MFLDHGHSNVKPLEFSIFLKHQSLNDIFTDITKEEKTSNVMD